MSEAGEIPYGEGEPPAPPPSHMAVAVLSLIGIFVSGYLALYNYGLLGVIQCTTGGCATVQSSAYAWFPPRTVAGVGIPVSVMGIAAYLILFVLAMVGVQPARAGDRRLGWAIFSLAAGGVVFSAYLTYLEAAVIHAWCQWCVVSAVLITVIFLFSLAGLKQGRSGGREASLLSTVSFRGNHPSPPRLRR